MSPGTMQGFCQPVVSSLHEEVTSTLPGSGTLLVSLMALGAGSRRASPASCLSEESLGPCPVLKIRRETLHTRSESSVLRVLGPMGMVARARNRPNLIAVFWPGEAPP